MELAELPKSGRLSVPQIPPQSERPFVRLWIVKGIHKSAWLLAVVSGLLQVLIFPRPNLYWLCWIALAPLMYALLRAREADADRAADRRDLFVSGSGAAWQGFLLGWASGTVFYFGTCYWVYSVMHSYGGLSPVVSVLLLILFSLYIGLHHGIFGALMAMAGRVAGRLQPQGAGAGAVPVGCGGAAASLRGELSVGCCWEPRRSTTFPWRGWRASPACMECRLRSRW